MQTEKYLQPKRYLGNGVAGIDQKSEGIVLLSILPDLLKVEIEGVHARPEDLVVLVADPCDCVLDTAHLAPLDHTHWHHAAVISRKGRDGQSV